MIDFENSLIEVIELPIGPDAPHRRAVRRLIDELAPVRFGRSHMRAHVYDVLFNPLGVEVWVRLPVVLVRIPDDVSACIAALVRLDSGCTEKRRG